MDILKYVDYKETLPTPDNVHYCRYLHKDMLTGVKKCIVIKSDTGTGKTTLFKNHVKTNNLKFISVGSRMALVDEQHRVFTEAGINTLHYKDISHHGYINEDISIVSTIDSISLLSEIDDFSDYVLFLDEFNSLIEYIFMADKCLNNKRLKVLTTLIYIMRNCKQIIATDADISGICFTLLEYTNIEYQYIRNTYKHNKGIAVQEVKNINDIIEKVKQCILNNENYLVCCDTKKYADYIYISIGEKGCLYTSDNDERIVISNEKMLIISPKMLYGNDSTIGRTVFCVYTGTSITPSNMVQQINRERKISEIFLYFEGRKYNPPIYDNKQDCIDYTKTVNKKSIKEFGMIDKNLSNMFIDIYTELEYRYDCYNTNKYCHLIKLLQTRGFVVNPLHAQNAKPKMKKVKEVVQEWRNEHFDADRYKELTDILKLNSEQIMEYKDFYTDNYKLTNHFNIATYHLQSTDSDTLLDKLDKVNDFPIKKLKHDRNKMVMLRQFEEATGFDLSTMTCANGLTEKKITKYNKEIKKVFGLTRKLFDYSDTKVCVKQIFDCYKQLFGHELITNKKQKVKGTRNTETVYIFKGFGIHKDLYDIRTKSDRFDNCQID